MAGLEKLIRKKRRQKGSASVEHKVPDDVLQNQPRTFEEWEAWVQELGQILEPGVGLIFSKTPLTDDHDVPIKWSYELYCLGCGRNDDGSFDPLSQAEISKMQRSFVIKASRASGKTLLLAIVGFSLFRWNNDYCWNHTAAVLEQADRVWGYLNRLYESGKFKNQIKKFTKNRIELYNGSEANITTGTEKGQNSKHPQFATYDEVEQMDISVIREGKLAGRQKRTADGLRLPPLFVYCSTQKRAITRCSSS